MKSFFKTVATSLLLTILFSFLLNNTAQQAHAGSMKPGEHTKAELIKLGERMYREGILPSGKPMEGFTRGDVAVDSKAYSCSSCHLRAGIGTFEGGVIIPPTSGKKLYKPYRRPLAMGDKAEKEGRYIYKDGLVERPAYSRDTLAKALRTGTDSAGQAFNDVMPRYRLSDSDMSILISYLEQLSSEPSPGISLDEFRFATIISDDVSLADRQALLGPIKAFIARKNQQLDMYEDFIKFGYSPTAEMQFAFRKASLDIWELKGASASWPKQLAEYYGKNPVFAVLGGISNSDWKPVHDFCESQRLPCLFPITDYPVVSENSWYTYYFNKGYYQEGEAVASYLNRLETLSAESGILQIVQDSPMGKALAAGFLKNWKDLERLDITTVTLSQNQILDQSTLENLITKNKSQILILWADDAVLQNLPKLVPRLSTGGMVFMSSSYLGKKSTDIPEAVRNSVYLAFPYRLAPYTGAKTGGFAAPLPNLASAKDLGDRRIESRSAGILLQVVLQGLNLIYGNLQRDHLLDIMSIQMDVVLRDYERISFGAGQRYVSRGCYIIQLGPGAEPAMIPRSEWVIH